MIWNHHCWTQEHFIIALVSESAKQTEFLLYYFYFNNLWRSFHWNNHAPLSIIEKCTPLIIISAAGNGGCWQIFSRRKNRLLGYSFWKLICKLFVWVTTRTIYLGLTLPLVMDLLAKLVTHKIWPGRRPYSRSTTISTVVDIEVNFPQSYV